MTEIAILKLGDKVFEPIKCIFGIQIHTEGWSDEEQKWLYGPDYLHANYWIEIKVNNDSGEDGAPAPDANYIPVQRITDGEGLLPSELPGIVVDDQGDWEAWYGNDSPELTKNCIEFLKYENGLLSIDWSAEFGFETKNKFHFNGPLQVDHIKISVKHEKDTDEYFTQIFGNSALSKVTKHIGDWYDRGSYFPQERRKWIDASFILANK